MVELGNAQKILAKDISTIHVINGYLDSGTAFYTIVQTDAIVGEKIKESSNNQEIAKLIEKGTIIERGFGHEIPKEIIKKYRLDEKSLSIFELLDKKTRPPKN